MKMLFNEFDLRTYPTANHWRIRFELRECKGGGAPSAPSYYDQISGELKAKSELAPTVFGTEAQFDPMYAALNNSLLQDTLFGNATDQTFTVPNAGYQPAMDSYNQALAAYNQNLAQSANADATPWNRGISQFGGPRGGNILPKIPAPIAPTISPTTSITLPRSQGIIGMAQQAAGQLATGQRQNQVGDMATLGPAARTAIARSNPQLARILSTMMDQSQSQLGLGGNLTAPMLRQAQQTVRARQAGMLGGTGTAGDFGEALGISQFGQNLYQQRLANAGNAAQLSNQFYTPQISNLMNASYNPTAAYGMGYQQNSGIGPRLFGSDVNAGQAFNNQYAAQLNNYNSQQNNQNALLGAGIAGAALLAGAFL